MTTIESTITIKKASYYSLNREKILAKMKENDTNAKAYAARREKILVVTPKVVKDPLPSYYSRHREEIKAYDQRRRMVTDDERASTNLRLREAYNVKKAQFLVDLNELKAVDQVPELTGVRSTRQRDAAYGINPLRKQNREYYAKNVEKETARCLAWAGNNREHCNAFSRKYYEENRDLVIAQS